MATPDNLAEFEEKRLATYRDQLEAYLKHWLIDDYPARAAKAWSRDYTSIEAFVKSVEPNRARWRAFLKPPKLSPTGDLRREPHRCFPDFEAEWLTLPLDPPLTAEALLAVPPDAKAGKPVPLVIAQHGFGSCPERTFGLLDESGIYHGYSTEMVKAGYAVLAPMNIRQCDDYEIVPRLCRLADTTLFGIELIRTQTLLDAVLKDPRIDGDHIGMWGISWGGLATQFYMPLEPRIKAGITCGFFNHRRNKMANPGKLYSSFNTNIGSHAYLDGWLTEFTDSDAACLICPRPLMVQHGKRDGIGHWPGIVEEFEATKAHYAKLGIADRAELDLHEGRHEISLAPGMRFLAKWL